MKAVIFALLIIAAVTRASAARSGAVVLSRDGVYSFVGAGAASTEEDRVVLSKGSFQDTLNSTGWGILNVHTVASAGATPAQQAYAAGFLEGQLTGGEIKVQADNLYALFFAKRPRNKPPADILAFFEKQEEWMRAQIAANPDDDYWRAAGLVEAQFNGLVDGYARAHGAAAPLSRFDFYILNGVGDLFDIRPAVRRAPGSPWRRDPLDMDEHEAAAYLFHDRTGLCSAIVKLTGDARELFTAHSAWFLFGATNRIYKHYDWRSLQQPLGAAAGRVSFSSYAGMLSSLDDFYMMDSGLVMTQTTNAVVNQTLYDLVTPRSLLAWHRVRLANQMAAGGEQWYRAFARHNSGTYTNQYMLVDYNLFTPGEPLPYHNVLWVVEQIPGRVAGVDMTAQLERGYWASYNVPAIESIFVESGFPAMVEKHGKQYSYSMAARAQLFRRDQASVTDVESLKHLMRSNDFRHDPISAGNPMWAICSRGDLQTGSNAAPVGCYDTKLTSAAMLGAMKSFAINGPTRANGTLPPFKWAGQFSAQPHEGLPPVYDFDFVEMQPDY